MTVKTSNTNTRKAPAVKEEYDVTFSQPVKSIIVIVNVTVTDNKPVVRRSTVQPWFSRHLTQGSHQYTTGWACGKPTKVGEEVAGSPEAGQDMTSKDRTQENLKTVQSR